MKSLFVALLLALVSFQAAAKSSDELFDAGQFDKAFRAAYADALKGNSADAFVVGRILLEGLGSAEKDQQLAKRLLEKSSDAKNMAAAEYLGQAYYEAKLLPKSYNLAYKYLSLAKDLGADNLDDLLIEIASNLDGEISKETCSLYSEDKRNPDFAFNLGQCIENAFLEGSANDFYLKAFDDGEASALIPAMRLALNQDDELLSRVFERLETFLLDARKSETKEMTDMVKSNQLALFEIAKREKNDDLSYQIAVYYDEGTLFGKTDKKRALNFYQLAKSQGKSGLNSKIQILTVDVEGATSKGACRGYSKNDKTLAKRLAKCAQKGHIKGNPGEYFLLAFANGDTGSFLDAAETLIDRTDKAFAPEKILNAIPDFRNKANANQKEKFAALIERKGHSSQDCEEKFDSLNSKISGDIYSCLLSAETAEFSGDFTAVEVAISAWKNGYGDVLSNPAHAERLEQLLINSSSADGLMILAALEKEPKEHFNQAVKFFEEGRITKEEVTQALVLEFQLFSEGRWSEFARSARHQDEIELLIETAELSLLPPEILAEFLAFLVKEQNELANSEFVQSKINAINFDLAWAEILKDIAFDVAGTFVSLHVDSNCDALQMAIDYEGLVSNENLADAKKVQLSKCDIYDISGEDLQELILSNSAEGLKRLGILLSSGDKPKCGYIAVYLENEAAFLASKQRVRFSVSKHIDRCLSSDKTIGALIAEKYLLQENFKKSFEIAEKSCPLSARACTIAGYIEAFRLADKTLEPSEAFSSATGFLEDAWNGGDLDASLAYLRIVTPSLFKGNILTASETKSKAIMRKLENSNYAGLPIVRAEKCALGSNIFANCRDECLAVVELLENESITVMQRLHGKRVLGIQKCISGLN